MSKQTVRGAVPLLVALVGVLALAGCASDRQPGSAIEDGAIEQAGEGTLLFVANGEEYAREGLRSEDGWDITFEHAYVTVAAITAYQTDPPHAVENGWDIDYEQAAKLAGVHTVDLARPDSDPAIVGTRSGVPSGYYNALAWNMVRAAEGPSEGYAIVFIGTAERGSEVVEFTLRFDREIAYQGGQFVGEERKGFLEAGGEAEAEMTFHFDHFFGRADMGPEYGLNATALGFDPLARLAANGVLDASMNDLVASLDTEDLSKLEAILLHFGHVGEGHALARPLR